EPRRVELLAQYATLLEERNARANLTAARGIDEIVDTLILRSLRLLHALSQEERESLSGRNAQVMDVGSGAGVPGLIIKIALPGVRMTLLDATRKRTDFMEEAVDALALEGVTVIHGRAEELARAAGARESYDCVLSRAVAALPELAELTLPLCRVGGKVLSLKGQDVGREISDAAWAVQTLGSERSETTTIARPGSAPADTVVVWRKTSPTPDLYPRRVGIPHKRPLARRAPLEESEPLSS
ncbi:MAG: 16S rRNA (guanine(527)-N(7))-methyltransferase RsmG, partial [Chloroflexota bacterium]